MISLFHVCEKHVMIIRICCESSVVMDHDFWLERWDTNQIGFHQTEFHPMLVKHWHSMTHPRSNVLVPLCGKSRDMHWLQSQGLTVIGSELSERAMSEFIENSEASFTSRSVASFTSHKAPGYHLLVGDFFALNRNQIGAVDCVYDRAALVALPQEIRDQYVQQLQNLLQPKTEILLITFAYDQSKRDGPPFSIDHKEVQRLFASWCEIELLETIITDEFGSTEENPTTENCYRLIVS